MLIPLALVTLVSIHGASDAGRIQLVFDAPVSFASSPDSSPSRLVLDVHAATATPEARAAARTAGLGLEDLAEPQRLRVTLPIPDGATAVAASRGDSIEILSRPPRADLGGIASAVVMPASDLLLGPEDLLEVSVFELPELKTTTRVLGDGTVSLPLVGVVQAAGLTRTEFEAKLRDLLEERFIQDPQVTITVTEYRSRQVSVIGAVTKPGTYQMIGPRNLLQMISEAGGLTNDAGKEILILRRDESGRAERLRLDLDDLVIKGDPELNIALSPGDVINVPVDRPIFVYVDGAVKTPGQVESRTSRPITLLQAVARAGGLTERANLRGVHVLRKSAEGGQIRIPVNLREIRKGKSDDIDLMDGDVVVVPETFF